MDRNFPWVMVAFAVFSCLLMTDWVERLRKFLRREKTTLDIIAAIEKLAGLRQAGSITEEEFARLRQRCLAEMHDRATDREPSESALGHVERLADLHDQGILTVEEFAEARSPFLGLGAPGPSADDLAGIAHIEKLSNLMEEGRISEREFAEQKRAIFGGRPAAMAKPVSAWDDLDGP